MKKSIYSALLALLALALAAACSSEDGIVRDTEKNVKILTTDLVIPPSGGMGYITFSAEGQVQVTAEKDWCQVSLSGNRVDISVGPKSGRESRYSRVYLQSGDESIYVTVQQLGEVLSGLVPGESDVTAPVEGTVLEYPLTTNLEVLLETDKDWIRTEVVKGEGTEMLVRIIIAENTDIGVRTGTVRYTAGSNTGTFHVLQYPQVVRETDWTLAIGEGSFVYPHQENTVTVTAGASVADQKYVWTVVPASAVTTDIKDYIFDVFALEKKNEIEAAVASGEISSFADGLVSGNQSTTLSDMAGDYYVMLVGYDDMGFVSGLYQWELITVADARPVYYRWAGKWTLNGTSFDNSPYSEVITITVDENDRNADGSLRERRLIVSGFGSKAVEAWGAPEEINQFYVKFDAETGAITFYGQNTTGTFTRSSLGDGCKLQLMSMYVKAGATSYTNATGYDFMSATLDGQNAAQITILERSAGLPWLVARIRCLNAAGSAYTTTGANDAGLKLDKPLTMTRAH